MAGNTLGRGLVALFVLGWGMVQEASAGSLIVNGATVVVASNSITFDLIQHPTANKNVFGTQFDANGEVTDWGSNYLMYHIQMQSTPNISTFDKFYARVWANRGNNTASDNPLRVSLFINEPRPTQGGNQTGGHTSLLNRAAVSPTFTQFLIGASVPDAVAPDIEVPDSFMQNYYLVFYAGGSVANQGYGVKIDEMDKQLGYFAPDKPGVTMKYKKNDNDTTFTTSSVIPDGIPEPSSSSLFLAGLASWLGWRRKRLNR